MKGYLYEIDNDKKEELVGYLEDMLRCGGKMMQCLEEITDTNASMGNRMGYRQGVRGTGRYGMRGGMGMREEPDMDYREPNRPGMMGYRDLYYN